MTNEVNTPSPSLVLMAEDQIRQLIGKVIHEELTKHTISQEPPRTTSDKVSIDEAVCHLKEEGFPLKKSSVYKLTHRDEIPYQKIGKRLIFSRSALTAWVAEKVETREARSDAALNLAASANLKR